MKALSVCQPFAQLIVSGFKRYETRPWCTSFRGRLFIHASRSVRTDHTRLFELAAIGNHLGNLGFENFNALPLGAIVGEATLTRIFMTEQVSDDLADEEKAVGDYSINRYAFRLEGPLMYERPIPASGKLGLWELEDSDAASAAGLAVRVRRASRFA